MNSIFSKSAVLLTISAALLSFSPMGGEGFEISLNGKMVIQRYGPNINEVARLQLNEHSPADNITIAYHHCGKVGTNRVLTFRDKQDRLVKEWRFPDSKASFGVISCTAGDILPLMKPGNTVLKLYYSSSELPNGRLLTSITTAKSSVASRR